MTVTPEDCLLTEHRNSLELLKAELAFLLSACPPLRPHYHNWSDVPDSQLLTTTDRSFTTKRLLEPNSVANEHLPFRCWKHWQSRIEDTKYKIKRVRQAVHFPSASLDPCDNTIITVEDFGTATTRIETSVAVQGAPEGRTAAPEVEEKGGRSRSLRGDGADRGGAVDRREKIPQAEEPSRQTPRGIMRTLRIFHAFWSTLQSLYDLLPLPLRQHIDLPPALPPIEDFPRPVLPLVSPLPPLLLPLLASVKGLGAYTPSTPQSAQRVSPTAPGLNPDCFFIERPDQPLDPTQPQIARAQLTSLISESRRTPTVRRPPSFPSVDVDRTRRSRTGEAPDSSSEASGDDDDDEDIFSLTHDNFAARLLRHRQRPEPRPQESVAISGFTDYQFGKGLEGISGLSEFPTPVRGEQRLDREQPRSLSRVMDPQSQAIGGSASFRVPDRDAFRTRAKPAESLRISGLSNYQFGRGTEGISGLTDF